MLILFIRCRLSWISRAWATLSAKDSNSNVTAKTSAFGKGNRIGRITTAGKITEFGLPAPDSQPTGIASGGDGNLWVIEFQARRIARITPKGRVIGEFQLAPDAAPFDIATQTDGSIWVTSRGDTAIWRIPPDGSNPREFQLGRGSAPALIAIGPDGNVWFTDMNGKIGRITASGLVSEFPIVAD